MVPKIAKPNVIGEKLQNLLLCEKRARKMLMKLTPGYLIPVYKSEFGLILAPFTESAQPKFACIYGIKIHLLTLFSRTERFHLVKVRRDIMTAHILSTHYIKF